MSENQVITNMENEVEEMTSIHYLNQDNAVFERTEGGFFYLFLTRERSGTGFR